MLLKLRSPFAAVRKKPRNYRERLSYVNLKAACATLCIGYSAHLQHFKIGASGHRLDTLFDFTPISFTANYFRVNYHGFDNWALMHRSLSPFAAQKPAFWCQKYEDQNDHTQEIPLPGVPRVIPEEDLLKCGKQASHVSKLAS